MHLPFPLPAAAALPFPPLDPAAAIPAVALIGLGLVAWFFARRRPRPSRLVEIVETASLGPKRALIVAKVGGELLILGASEAGISLLGTRSGAPKPTAAVAPAAPRAEARPAAPTPGPAPAPAARAAAPAPVPPPLRTDVPAAAGPGLLGRLGLKRAQVPGGFEPLLRESLEDQELRAKVAAGLRGIVT